MNRPLLSGGVALGLLLVSTSLMAQDDVLAGYRKYYSGDTAGARDVLNRVLQSAPGHLPARFGLLHMLQDRVDEDPALQPSFERDLDCFWPTPRNATIAPVETPKHSSILRVLRLFLFLPGGNRSEGLRQIERAHSNGSLFSVPAGMILMEIYSTYEHKGLEAVRIGERLFREYPNNPGLQLRRNLCESGDRRL